MYQKFTTPALVLSVYRSRESAVVNVLLTRDYGVVSATAEGIRCLNSKLRSGLTQFAYSDITLVRGRGGWRIVTAEPRSHFYNDLRDNPAARKVVARVALLCRRLMDESADGQALFHTVLTGFRMLAHSGQSQLPAIERLTVLRLLFVLGYLENRPVWREFLESESWDESLVSRMSMPELIDQATYDINRSLSESGL